MKRIIAILFLLSSFVFSRGELSGIVKNDKGVRLFSGVAISLQNTETSKVYNASPLKDGSFLIKKIINGRYKLSVQLDGYSTFSRTLVFDGGRLFNIDKKNIQVKLSPRVVLKPGFNRYTSEEILTVIGYLLLITIMLILMFKDQNKKIIEEKKIGSKKAKKPKKEKELKEKKIESKKAKKPKMVKTAIDIEYEILYNDNDEFFLEESLQAGCLDPDGGKIYTDHSNFFNVIRPEGDRKNSNLKNNDNKYSSFENRTATYSIEYDCSRISDIEQKISLFQFDQETGIMLEFDRTKIGKINVLKVKELEEREVQELEEREKKRLNDFYAKRIDEKIYEEPHQATSLVGTGFLISKEGYIATANHVIDNASLIVVRFPFLNLDFNASLVSSNEDNDVALLKIPKIKFKINDIPFFISNQNKFDLGQDVYSYGYPLGENLGTKPSFSDGRISSFEGVNGDSTTYRISNPIQPGNSGGPVVDNKGRLLGIIVSSLDAVASLELADALPQNVNFAVKTDYLIELSEKTFSESWASDIFKNKNKPIELSPTELTKKILPFVPQIRINTPDIANEIRNEREKPKGLLGNLADGLNKWLDEIE